MREKIKAIFCSDIHLSQTPPVFRSKEPDWKEAMRRPLNEIKEIQKEHNCPVFCAGDVLDYWKSTPELIHFATDVLPAEFHSVPGQHDLPYHQTEAITKSAYYTLWLFENIKELIVKPVKLHYGSLVICCFPFGSKIQPLRKMIDKKKKNDVYIALAHQYIWKGQFKYQTADGEAHISKLKTALKGYDFAFFGDNHKGFDAKLGKTKVHNCGGLIRRNKDEIDRKSRIILLTENNKTKTHYLDTSDDIYFGVTDNKKETLNLDDAFAEMEKIENTKLDFVSTLKEYTAKNNVKKPTMNIINEILEESNNE